ncbi:MAG: protein kinase [Candidatus Obscuribacterales bacterium]|nr:protein kinase [Candidatus Obscuribacterales bacterium]
MSKIEPTDEQLKTHISESTDAPLAMQPGDTILGKFKIVELLGVGGMGSVYRVDHLYLGRQFALKCLNRQHANDVSWRRFQNEAKAASKLDHPNLIKVHEFDLMPDGRPFILMDLVQGKTLSELTKSSGSLSVQHAIDIIIQVAFAIQYAHDQGIVHRDLKPTNIMVIPPSVEGEKETIKLVDFGIAKLTGIDEFNQQTLTKTGEIFGSPLYMSPEQCTGTLVDHRSDLYSIGCVFYELLTGAPPFIGENALSTMMKHQGEMALSLKEASLGKSFPQPLDQIVSKLLEKDPNLRYQSGNALVVDLLPLIKDDEMTVNRLAQLGSSLQLTVKQGQTTQLRVRDSKSKTTKRRFADIVISIVIGFVAGFATCYFCLQKSVQEEIKSSKLVPGETRYNIVPGSFYRKYGKNAFFDFPKNLPTLGFLCFNSKMQSYARASVRIPDNALIGFEADPFTLEHPELLDGFRDNDLSLIDFGNNDKGGSLALAKLARFKNLKALNLAKTAITGSDLKYLQPLESLVCLVVGFNLHLKAKDLLGLKILKNLRVLDIADMTDAHEIMGELAALQNLRQLILANCKLKNDDLRVISKSKSIQILSLSGNVQLTDEGVKHLENMHQLQWLVLTGTSVTKKSLETLLSLRNLRRLELIATHCSDKESAEIESALKQARPGFKFYRTEVAPQDTKLTMPEFPWIGPGLYTHLDEVQINRELERGFSLAPNAN